MVRPIACSFGLPCGISQLLHFKFHETLNIKLEHYTRTASYRSQFRTAVITQIIRLLREIHHPYFLVQLLLQMASWPFHGYLAK
jgi:hypothetical protein